MSTSKGFLIGAALAGLAMVIGVGCAELAHAEPAKPIPASPASLQHRAQVIREAQMRFGVPAPAPVIAGQIQQESAWNPLAQSRVGAQGLMQFMPGTSAWATTAAGWDTNQPTNAAWSIRAGVWYDRWLYERVTVAASECDRWHFTLSAYNGGLGYVYKRQRLSSAPGFWDQTGSINPGIHPANQTENEAYPARILFRHQPGFRAWGRVVCLP